MSEADKEMELPKEGRYSPAQIVEAKKNTSGSLVEIIQYAGRDIETANEFREAVEEFISLEDKKSSKRKVQKFPLLFLCF